MAGPSTGLAQNMRRTTGQEKQCEGNHIVEANISEVRGRPELATLHTCPGGVEEPTLLNTTSP